jgi:hypothetical protein
MGRPMANADTSALERSPNLLVLGDFFSPTMTPLRLFVEHLVESGCDACFAAGIAELAARSTDDGWFPELVIVCQHGSDEFAEPDVHRLIGLFPLARLVCCYGHWCASDGRTRDIWPLAVRVPVDAATERVRRELDVLSGRRPPLPLTASRDEIFLFDNALD